MEDKSLSLWEIPLGVHKSKLNKFDPKEIKRGIYIEKEHTTSPVIAKQIALDHLKEDPQYYTKLKKIFKH